MNMFVFFAYLIMCGFSEFVIVTAMLAGSGDSEAYYWRDYSGDIPSDAVPGGTDKAEKIFYIGQAVHSEEDRCSIIPGQIDASQKKLIYHYDAKSHEVTTGVKILCSPYPGQFEWIPTNIEGVRFLTQKHLVPGGYDSDYPLLIGRASINGEVLVGKVTVYHKFAGFAFVEDGKGRYQGSNYEVLSYKPRCACITPE